MLLGLGRKFPPKAKPMVRPLREIPRRDSLKITASITHSNAWGSHCCSACRLRSTHPPSSGWGARRGVGIRLLKLAEGRLVPWHDRLIPTLAKHLKSQVQANMQCRCMQLAPSPEPQGHLMSFLVWPRLESLQSAVPRSLKPEPGSVLPQKADRACRAADTSTLQKASATEHLPSTTRRKTSAPSSFLNTDLSQVHGLNKLWIGFC